MATTIKGIEFKCPKCGYDTIEEIMTDVVMSTSIRDIDEGVDYHDNQFSADGGVVDRYQCVQCGHVIAKTEEELMAYVEHFKGEAFIKEALNVVNKIIAE